MPAKKVKKPELDSVYFLKLVLYLVVGSQWLWIVSGSGSKFPLPIGLIVGLLFAKHEHFQTDRKIEYALLIGAMFIGYWLPLGITVIL